MIRWRREIKPWSRFEIETRLGGIDDRNLWVYQTFHYPEEESDKEKEPNSNKRGKVLAQVLTQGVITNKGKIINPRSWLEEHFPATKEMIDDLATSSSEAGSLFDEKASRFMHLEDSMRKSAAIHDEKSAKWCSYVVFS